MPYGCISASQLQFPPWSGWEMGLGVMKLRPAFVPNEIQVTSHVMRRWNGSEIPHLRRCCNSFCMQLERGDACASSDLRWRSRRCCSRSAPYPARSHWPRRTSAAAKPAGRRTECNSKPLRVHFENMTDTDLWRRRAQQRGFHPAHTLTSHFIRYISLGSSSLLPFCGLQLVCSIFSDLWPFYFSTQLLLARSFLFLGSFSVNTESLPMWQTGKFAIHVYKPLIISPSKEGWWVRSLIFHCDYSECKNIRLLDQTPTSIKLHFAWYIQ